MANYVVSLAKTESVVRAENTVVKAGKLVDKLPSTTADPVWQQAEPTSFYLVPQIIAKQRFFTPSNDTLTVRALYNDKDIALLLEWDDRTNSKPGDEEAEKIADAPIGEDAIAVQLPVNIPEGTEKPYFGMGDTSHPVNIWHWKSGTTDKPESITLANSKGFKEIEQRDAKAVDLSIKSHYQNGTWQVLMTRPLLTSEKDIQFSEGRFIPIAFAAWDGSNGEKGSKHTMTTWYWLQLKPASSSKPLIVALLVMLLIFGALVWWAKSASKNVTTS